MIITIFEIKIEKVNETSLNGKLNSKSMNRK